MPTTANFNLEYEESVNQSVSLTPGSSTASRFIQIPGDQEDLYYQAFVGWSTIADGAIKRWLPEIHPKWPYLYAREFRYAREVGEFSAGGPVGSLIFGKVEVEIVYKEVDYAVVGDADGVSIPGSVKSEAWRYVSVQETLDVQNVPVARGSFIFEKPAGGGPDNDIPAEPAKAVPAFTVHVLWREVPAVVKFNLPRLTADLKGRIDGALGTINSAALWDYPARTLLLLSAEPTFYHQADGSWAADVKYTMAGRGRIDNSGVVAGAGAITPDWDRVMKPGDFLFYRAVLKSDNTKRIYTATEFFDLFKV